VVVVVVVIVVVVVVLVLVVVVGTRGMFVAYKLTQNLLV